MENEGGVFCVFSFGTFLKSLKVYFVEIIFTSEALILKFKFLKMIKTLTLKKQICNLDETTLANNKLSG